MFIFVRLVPDTGNYRRNNGIRKSAACQELAQFFAKLIPLQTFQAGRPFLGSFIGESSIIHTFHCGRNSLIVESFLAKFHSHHPTAARAKGTSIFHPRTSKLIVVRKPSLSQPFERLLDHWLRDLVLAEVLPNFGFGT